MVINNKTAGEWRWQYTGLKLMYRYSTNHKRARGLYVIYLYYSYVELIYLYQTVIGADYGRIPWLFGFTELTLLQTRASQIGSL